MNKSQTNEFHEVLLCHQIMLRLFLLSPKQFKIRNCLLYRILMFKINFIRERNKRIPIFILKVQFTHKLLKTLEYFPGIYCREI